MRNKILKTVFPKTRTKRLDLIADKAAVALGCYSDGGKIIPALSAGAFRGELPAGITKIAYSYATKMFFICADKNLYCCVPKNSAVKIAALNCDNPSIVDDYGENGLTTFAIGEGNYVVYGDGSFTERPITLGIYGGLLKNGRLFGVDKTDRYTVRWSGINGLFDSAEGIDGAGWLKLDGSRGKILNLVNFDDKLVVVCEFGLTVLSAYGTTENFKLQSTDTGTGRIYANSAAVAGGKLLFCTADGIYAFDGSKISKPEIHAQYKVSEPCFAAGLGENYFLCGYSKSLERRAVFAFDVFKETRYFIDAPAEMLAACDRVYCVAGGIATFEKSGSFDYICGSIDFDTPDRKVLTEILIDCDGDVEVTIESGGKKRSFTAVKRRLRVDMCGSEFKIAVKAKREIRALKAYAEVQNGI